MNREFKLIEGFPGYRVSLDGIVESCLVRRGRGRGKGSKTVTSDHWKPLKQYIGRHGYPIVNLGKGNSRNVARLVLETFYRKPHPGEECRHLDGNRANSDLLNLDWGSSRENTEDQRLHQTLIGGERHGMAKITNAQVDEIRALQGKLSQAKIGKLFGISQCHVSDILAGKRRTKSSHDGKGLKYG